MIALAHELGHVADPATTADNQLKKGTLAHARRAVEREKAAWDFAEQLLAAELVWTEIKDDFEATRKYAEECYQAKVDALA